ncbi:Integrase catalytic region [Neochlamydia sp. S13]|nr:Integrase catalytic region [Neochlamydia sp. S13]
MNGKGRATDNIFVERSWRPVKYEDVYLRDYQDELEVYQALIKYFEFYIKKPSTSVFKIHDPSKGIGYNNLLGRNEKSKIQC